MPARLIASLFTGPFGSHLSTGRTLTTLGEIALTAIQVLAIYTRNQPFSPVEFAAAYAAILAAGGYASAKTDQVAVNMANSQQERSNQ